MKDDHEFLQVPRRLQACEWKFALSSTSPFIFPWLPWWILPRCVQAKSSQEKILGLQWFGRAESWPPCLMLQIYRLGSLLKRLKGEADEERQKAGPTLFTWKKMAKSQSDHFTQFQLRDPDIRVCLEMGYTTNYSHLVGIMIINHWV